MPNPPSATGGGSAPRAVPGRRTASAAEPPLASATFGERRGHGAGRERRVGRRRSAASVVRRRRARRQGRLRLRLRRRRRERRRPAAIVVGVGPCLPRLDDEEPRGQQRRPRAGPRRRPGPARRSCPSSTSPSAARGVAVDGRSAAGAGGSGDRAAAAARRGRAAAAAGRASSARGRRAPRPAGGGGISVVGRGGRRRRRGGTGGGATRVGASVLAVCADTSVPRPSSVGADVADAPRAVSTSLWRSVGVDAARGSAPAGRRPARGRVW